MDIHSRKCLLIQIWIWLKKLYFYRKWENQLTHKSVSTFIYLQKCTWMKNWIDIIIVRDKLKVKCLLNILPLYNSPPWIWWLSISIFLSIIYPIYPTFIHNVKCWVLLTVGNYRLKSKSYSMSYRLNIG